MSDGYWAALALYLLGLPIALTMFFESTERALAKACGDLRVPRRNYQRLGACLTLAATAFWPAMALFVLVAMATRGKPAGGQ